MPAAVCAAVSAMFRAARAVAPAFTLRASRAEPCLVLRLISVANALACIGVRVSTIFAGELSPPPDEPVVSWLPIQILLHKYQPSPVQDYVDDSSPHVWCDSQLGSLLCDRPARNRMRLRL